MKHHPRSKLLLVLLLGSLPFIQGSSCIDLSQITNTVDKSVDKITESINQSVEKVNTTMSQAVDTLGQQSASWQGTLKTLESSLALDASNLESQTAQHASDLEKQIAHDVRGLVDQVDYVLKDGLQFSQEQFNCQNDIYNTHARIAVKNILSSFLNKYKYKGISDRAPDPFVPIVCSANPNGINVARWDLNTYLVLSGTDFNLFDTQKPSIVLVKADGSETVVTLSVGNRVTNYRYEVNVPVMISQNLFRNIIQLLVRWNGHKVNQNEIPVVPCGAFGSSCCRGGVCESGTCVNEVCGACGTVGQPCCPGSSCTSGVCVSGVCNACGGIGQPCCGGSTCGAGARCANNVCTACGTSGDTCCVGGTCNSPNQCINNICTVCGGTNQACCNGSTCNAGNTCVGGVCSLCGGLNQPCCAGSTCSSSSTRCTLSGANYVCAHCGSLNESCCNNNVCTSPGTCVSNHCSVVLPACQWTGSFSEESPGEGHCPQGFAVRGANCTGSNCDNIALYCCPYSSNGDPTGRVWSGWFSEENGGMPFPVSMANRFVTGMRCSGNYCDNLQLELIDTSRLHFVGGSCYQGAWYSEENAGSGGNQFICPANYWVGDVACSGSNCDNMALYCCQGQPVYLP